MGAVSVRKVFAWLRKNLGQRARTLTLGVALLAVPTLFGIFPSWTELHGGVRIAIAAVWCMVAAAAVIAATERDEAIHQLTEQRKAQLRKLRLFAAKQFLDALLRRGTKGIPEHYEFTVYMHDPGSHQLVAVWPPPDPRGGPDPRAFQPGKGATGSAWRDSRMVVVTGSEVANETYGLTPEQQVYFREYKSAAATPIWEYATTPFGVLTALGIEDDGYFEEEGPGPDTLNSLADAVGVLLTSLLEPGDLLTSVVTPNM